GVTGWVLAAGLAAARGVEMSSHLVPEVSVHLLAATPTAHWLEYVDWADAILEEPMQVIDGAVTPSARPGLGLAWDEAKLRRLSDRGGRSPGRPGLDPGDAQDSHRMTNPLASINRASAARPG